MENKNQKQMQETWWPCAALDTAWSPNFTEAKLPIDKSHSCDKPGGEGGRHQALAWYRTISSFPEIDHGIGISSRRNCHPEMPLPSERRKYVRGECVCVLGGDRVPLAYRRGATGLWPVLEMARELGIGELLYACL